MVLAVALGLCAAAAWLTTLYAVIRLSGMLSGRKSLFGMMLSGFAWFDARNFTPGAGPTLRLFGYGFAAFFVCVIAGAVLSVIATAPR